MQYWCVDTREVEFQTPKKERERKQKKEGETKVRKKIRRETNLQRNLIFHRVVILLYIGYWEKFVRDPLCQEFTDVPIFLSSRWNISAAFS